MAQPHPTTQITEIQVAKSAAHGGAHVRAPSKLAHRHLAIACDDLTDAAVPFVERLLLAPFFVDSASVARLSVARLSVASPGTLPLVA